MLGSYAGHMKSFLHFSFTKLFPFFHKGKIAFDIDGVEDTVPVGRTKLYEELNSGRLRAKKLGDKTIIPFWCLAEWLDGLPDYPVQAPAAGRPLPTVGHKGDRGGVK